MIDGTDATVSDDVEDHDGDTEAEARQDESQQGMPNETEREDMANAAGKHLAETDLPLIKPSIREHVTLLRNRLETVMGEAGKRPGDLKALSADLAEMAQFDHPLMDVTD